MGALLIPLGISLLAGSRSVPVQVAERKSPERTPSESVRLLEESLVRLTEGIPGSLDESEVRIGYDRNRHRFHVVLRSGLLVDPSGLGDRARYEIAEIGRDSFQSLLEDIDALGLSTLPLEDPPGVEDIYGWAAGLRVLYGTLDWENGGHRGCMLIRSRNKATDDDRQRHERIVSLIKSTVARLELIPSTELDACAAADAPSGQHLPFVRQALKLASARSDASDLDLNRAFVMGGRNPETVSVCVPWRIHQPILCWPPPGRRTDGVVVRLNIQDLSLREMKGERPSHWADDQARREAYVADHPNLAPHIAALVRGGWIRSGMREELVRAAWGEPDAVDPVARYRRGGRDVFLTFREGVLFSIDHHLPK